MPAGLGLFLDRDFTEPVDGLRLADVSITEGIAEGESREIFAFNSGDTVLREITVAVDGDGAEYVQLARGVDDQSGVWAAPGESIIIEGPIMPGDGFIFWTRPIYEFDDREGSYHFDFVVRAKSVGN